MNNSTILRLTLDEAFTWLDQVIEGMTTEQYAWQPDGSANPVSKLHAHTLNSADFWVNLMALGKPMQWMTVSQKLGLPSNMIEIWGTEAPINLPDMLDYQRELRAQVLPDIEALTDEALTRELTAPMFGKRDVGFVVRLSAMQLAIHTGEISAAKGLQGLQGLPF
jgi:hypothetical protein